MDDHTYQVSEFKCNFPDNIKSQDIVLYYTYVCVYMRVLCNVFICPCV